MAQALAEFIRQAPNGDISLAELRDRQVELENEAKELLGKDVSVCTYRLGPLRQAVYACRTCDAAREQAKEGNEKESIGVCFACSVSCHTDHDLVELFIRRDFQCDCGTSRAGDTPCALLKPSEPARLTRNENLYDHNFRGEFCLCEKKYNSETEESDMFQCLVCQDWFHDECIGVHPHPDDWEHLVCQSCVQNKVRDTVGRWAGKEGMMLVDNDGNVCGYDETKKNEDALPTAEELLEDLKPAKNEEKPSDQVKDKDVQDDSLVNALVGCKRPRESNEACDERQPAKRVNHDEKEGSSSIPDTQVQNCKAPPSLDKRPDAPFFKSTTPFVFLDKDFRNRWCKCADCLRSFKGFEYLLYEEETYEPPEDRNADKSIMDPLDAKALDNLPRNQVIDGLLAWNKMQNRFQQFLSEFAASGRVVTEADVKEFFSNEKAKMMKRFESS